MLMKFGARMALLLLMACLTVPLNLVRADEELPATQSEFVPPGAKLEVLFDGACALTEGVAAAPDGMIYFSDITFSHQCRTDDGAIEAGHILAIDFVGRVGGETFEGGSGMDVEIEVGSERFIPGFEEQLIGARSGDDVEVRVTFPEGYADRDLAGKEAVFACHVTAVKKRQIPELDDEFAKDMGEFETLDALRQRVHEDLYETRERESKQVLRNSLMDALIERSDFEVPAGMVEYQLDRQLQAARQRLHGQAPDDDIDQQVARWREQWRDGAEREVRERLILEAVAEAQGIEVEDVEVDARIEAMAGQQGVSPAVLQQAYGDEGLKRSLRSQILAEKVLDFLTGRAKVEGTTDS